MSDARLDALMGVLVSLAEHEVLIDPTIDAHKTGIEGFTNVTITFTLIDAPSERR